jgi:hypothetical protein
MAERTAVRPAIHVSSVSNAMNEGCGPPGSSRTPPRSSTNRPGGNIARQLNQQELQPI